MVQVDRYTHTYNNNNTYVLHKNKIMSNVIEHIKASTDDKLTSLLDKYVNKWQFEVQSDTFIQTIMGVLNIETCTDVDQTLQSFTRTNHILVSIGSELKKRNMMNMENGGDVLVKFNGLLEKVHYAQKTLMQFVHFERTTNGGHDYNANIDTTMFKFTPIVYDDMKPFQKLIFQMLDYLEQNQLRRVDDICYEEIRSNGYGTHAWKPKCPMVEIINKQCNMIDNYGNWLLMTTSKEMDKQLVDHLTRTQDPRFPALVKDRNVFSFRNGIYFSVISKAKGVYTTTSTLPVYEALFVSYESDEYKLLDKNIVACKFFDMEYRLSKDSLEFETPALDSIYEYQKLSPEVIIINKMLLGRMLYDVGDLDNWQVIPFLLGAGGTGKSTINNIVRMFYDHEDVGIMANNYQKTFGLQDIYDKFAFIAPEIKRDWGIDQAEFQEIVSGGKLNVNVKHKPSVRVMWTAPGMLGGNENPGFVDNASSIQRRVVVTRFDHKVSNGDPQLSRKLELEMDVILTQCNMYYLQYARKYNNKDIWTVLPEYFMETQKMMAAASNALCAYLDSDILEFEESAYIPLDEFFKRFNMYCGENNLQKPKINVDFYRAPFAKYNLKVVTKMTKKYPAKSGRLYKNTTFIEGVDLKWDDEYDEL